jgi:hypothetical protein
MEKKTYQATDRSTIKISGFNFNNFEQLFFNY